MTLRNKDFQPKKLYEKVNGCRGTPLFSRLIDERSLIVKDQCERFDFKLQTNFCLFHFVSLTRFSGIKMEDRLEIFEMKFA